MSLAPRPAIDAVEEFLVMAATSAMRHSTMWRWTGCAGARWRRGAKSFEINGTANYPGAAALGASLALVNSIGIDEVEARVLGLSGALYEELDRLGVRLVTRPEVSARSGITAFEVSDDLAVNEALLGRLLDEHIYVSLRYTSGVGGIRVSTHYFNDESDLEVLLAAVRQFARNRLVGVGRT